MTDQARTILCLGLLQELIDLLYFMFDLRLHPIRLYENGYCIRKFFKQMTSLLQISLNGTR